MNNAEIQIQFPQPGDWTKLIMSVIYADALGFTHLDQYSETTLPKEQIPALAGAIEAIAALDEQWQACQVWARLGKVLSPIQPDGQSARSPSDCRGYRGFRGYKNIYP